MKKKIVLLTVLSLVFTAILGYGGMNSKYVTAAPAFQRVDFVSAQVLVDGLNVREGISTSNKIVCTLKKGQTVKVFGKLGDWYAIYEPATGCVGAASSKYLKPIYSQTPAPSTPKSTPAPTTPSKPQMPMATPTPQAQKPGNTPPPIGPSPAPNVGATADEQAMLNLVNKARADAGIGPLQFDAELLKVARLKAKDMVDNNYFSHQSPTYGSPFDMMKQFGINFKTAGENIAGNQTVDAAFKAWMNSPGHKANILNGNYNYTGIGIVSGSTYGKMFVQMFIGR